jgi:ABC-type glycerol-3-phosphate transport system permease component
LAIAVLATVWRSVPLLTLILLAAIKRIPESVHRAAQADGASAFEAFRYVTLPLIRRYVVLAGVLQLIMALQVFDTIYTLTGGGPGRSTTVLIYYIFEAAFKQLSLGYSAAMAVALTVLIGLCSLPLVLTRLQRIRAGGATAGALPQTSQGDDHLLTRRDAGAIARMNPLGPVPVEWEGHRLSPRPRSAAFVRALKRIAGASAVLLLVIWSVGPVLWIALASVQHEGAMTSIPLALTTPTLDNYTDLLFAERRGTFGSALPWLNGIWTSMQVAVVAAISTVLFGALIAYPVARLEFPLKGVLMVTLLITQMVPAIVLAIPVLFLFRALQLDDTVAGLALVSTAFHMPVVVWMLRSAFMDVPKSYERAARMDGCSRLGTILKISMPAAKPAILAAVILVLIGTWNEFLFAVVLGNTEAITVMRLIGTVEISSGPTGRAPYTLLAAAGFLAVLPVLVLVATFQRRIVNGLTEVHVKG